MVAMGHDWGSTVRCRVLSLLALPVAGALTAQNVPDPSADRAVAAATARQLPAGSVTLTAHLFFLLPAVTYGWGGWSTLTLGSSPAVLFAGGEGYFAFGSAKVRLVDRRLYAVSVGDFFTALGYQTGDIRAHFPFVVATLGGDAINVSGALARGFGDQDWDRERVDEWSWQVSGSVRLGSAARFVAEYMEPGDVRLVLFAFRLWDAGRPWFLELGGVYSANPAFDHRALLPWFSMGWRLRPRS